MFLFPWGDMHSLNLGWFLLQFKDWVEKIEDYLDNGGGTSENLANVIAPVFNAANYYSTGDYVLYNNELYKANQAVNPGTWDPDAWEPVLIVDEMGSGGGEAGVDNVARLMIAGQYSASFAYQKYAICRYNDILWMANTDLPAGGEAWDASHWDEITVGAGLTGLRRSVESFANAIADLENKEKATFSGLGMFNRIGVIGDSFASGGIRPDNNISVLYENSWPQIIGRKLGIAVTNYSASGYTTQDFVNANNAYYNTHGLGAILSDITNQKTCGLYIFALGINDSTVSNPPSTYLGSIADINTADPSQNPDTFFGNTGKIISTIIANAPNSKIVLQTFTRPANVTGTETYNTFNNAIIAIANLFTLPYVDIRNDPYFKSDYYQNNLATNNTQHYRHPTLDMYVGYANAIMRLYGDCIVNNSDYFYNYKNSGIYNERYYQASEVIKFANTYAHFMGVANSATQLRVFIPLNKPVKASSFTVAGGYYIKNPAFTQQEYGVITESSPSGYDSVFGNASIIENGIAFSLTFPENTFTPRELYAISTTSVNPLTITLT